MPKSPERKRFGIYYTPPEFTGFIVQNTIHAVIEERFEALAAEHAHDGKDMEADKPSPKISAYWLACLDSLRKSRSAIRPAAAAPFSPGRMTCWRSTTCVLRTACAG